jgi:group I intron endonuclease
MIIYKATNTVNNKVYIGQTTQKLKYRRTQHKCHANKRKDVYSNNYFYNAISKYGIDNFIWEEIDNAKTIDELNIKEQQWVQYYKSNQKRYGYNSTPGGGGQPESIRNKSKCKGKGHPLWRDDLDENKIIELRKQGFSMEKIAGIMKCSRRAIENRLKMFNNKITSKKTLKSIRKDKTKEQYKRPDIKGFSCKQLLEMRKTKTVKQISEETKLSMRMIFKKTKK